MSGNLKIVLVNSLRIPVVGNSILTASPLYILYSTGHLTRTVGPPPQAILQQMLVSILAFTQVSTDSLVIDSAPGESAPPTKSGANPTLLTRWV